MNVLFYEDPLTDHNAFMWCTPHIEKDLPCLIELIRSGADARMLLSDNFLQIAKAHGLANRSLIPIDEQAILPCLTSPHLNVNTLFHSYYGYLMGYTGIEGNPHDAKRARSITEAYAAVLLPELSGFTPDIIITWAPVPHLRLLFPDALILHKEVSLYTRPPYLLTYTLDPLGFHKWSYLAQSQLIRQEPADAIMALHRLRGALGDAFDALDNTADLLATTDSFRHRLLLANHTNGVFFHDSACGYRSQAHVVLDVLNHTRPDTAVIVTMHPDCVPLTERETDYLKRRFPNIFIFPELRSLSNAGQQLVRHVDSVATVCSSIGLQALLWQKPLHGLGDNHLRALSDDIAKASHESGRCDEIVSWLTFNYSYPDALLRRQSWMHDHLALRLAHWRRCGADGYFADPIAARSDLTAMHIEHASASTLLPFGRRLGTSRLSERIDFSNDAFFPSGWGSAEPSHFGVYRWTVNPKASIRLPIHKGPNCHFTIQLATHEGCDNQIVTIGVGSRTLLTVPLNLAAGAQTIVVPIPEDAIGELFTTVWIEATQTRPPYAGARSLGLISSVIHVSASKHNSPQHKRPRDCLYSIIIPTLNGRDSLATILPTLLASLPDDAELIISDNFSTDSTLRYLRQFDDPRLRVFSPPRQCDYGSHTDFAYSKATGVWLSHLGDDDQILPSRFSILEHVIAQCDAEMIFASRLRYHWPHYPESTLANTIDPAEFDDAVFLLSGKDAASRLVNCSNIRHTGAVVVHRDLVQRVRRANRGVYMPQRLGEYVAFRVASGLCTRVAFTNRPIVIIGRHPKSIGTSLHLGPGNGRRHRVDVEREIGSVHPGTGFHVQGHQPFSLEAAIHAIDVLAPAIGTLSLDFRRYYQLISRELESRVARGLLEPTEMQRAMESGQNELSALITLQSRSPLPFGCPVSAVPGWGWPERIDGQSVGVADINSAAAWFEHTFSSCQGSASLHFTTPQVGTTRWVDC